MTSGLSVGGPRTLRGDNWRAHELFTRNAHARPLLTPRSFGTNRAEPVRTRQRLDIRVCSGSFGRCEHRAIVRVRSRRLPSNLVRFRSRFLGIVHDQCHTTLLRLFMRVRLARGNEIIRASFM